MSQLATDISSMKDAGPATIGWFGGAAGKMIIVFAALVFLHILYVYFGWGGDEYKSIVSNIVSVVVYLITFVYTWRTSLCESLKRRTQWAWTFIALGHAAFLSGAVLWIYFENYLGEHPFPSLADVGYLGYFPLMIVGLLLLVEPMKRAEERLGFALDVTLVMAGGGLVMWYFLLAPLINAGDGFTLLTVLSVAYPVGDLVILFGIVTIILRRRTASGNLPVTLVLFGVVGNFAADFIFGYQSLQGTYVTGNWVDALWTLGCLPIALGAHYLTLTGPSELPDPEPRERRGAVVVLPYAAVACAFGVLILIALEETAHPHTGLDIIIATLLTTLLVLRQFMFLRENTRARAALTDLQERIQGIYSASTDGIGVADFEGNLVEVNDAFARLMGYTREELLTGHTFFDLTASRDREATLEVSTRVIETQQPVEYEKEYVRKDGSCFTASVTAFPIRSPKGTPSAIAAMVRDITERKRSENLLREAEERWQLALRVNHDGVWDWDLRNNKFYFSPRWREMFGYDPAVELPFTLAAYDELFHPDDRHLAHSTRDALKNSDSPYIDVEFRHRCSDNTYRWIRCRAEAVIDTATGRLERVIGLNTDISERKRREIESEAIGNILRGVSETSNVDELLSLVHGEIGRVIHAKNCFVALHDKLTDLFSMQFFVDEHDAIPASDTLQGTRSHYVFRTGRALLLDEHKTATLEAEGQFRLVGTQPKYWLGVPLRTPSEVIGVLVVQTYDEEHSYSNSDLEFLNNVGGPIALAIERKRVESKMLLLNTALDNAANGVVITDGDGTIEWVNQAFTTLTGYSADDVRAKSPRLLQSGKHTEEFYGEMWETITQGNVWKGEVTNRRKDGDLYDEEMTITPLYDEASRTNHFIAIKSDVTERKRAQDALRSSEEQHRLLFESNPFPAFVYDTSTLRFLAVNEAAISHYGYTRDEFLNVLTLKDIRPVRDTPELIERVARVTEDSDTIAAPSRHQKKDGTITQVEITSHVISFVGTRAEIVLVNDITDRLAAEEQLRIFNQKLQQSNRELQDFAYIASHDLQEPLRKVQTFADRLGSKYASALDETGLDYLERMRSAAQRMQTLIQDLLSFSRVTTKAQPFEPVALEEIARDVLSDLEINIEETGATIEIDGLPVIDADRSQMRQLVQNLVGNAIKFRRQGITPFVKVSAKRMENGSSGDYQITVEDNGIGFDEKYLDKIFTVFQRLHGRAEYEGSGIGLAVCRKIVERHHGTITAKSTPGSGATFILTLPENQSGAEPN